MMMVMRRSTMHSLKKICQSSQGLATTSGLAFMGLSSAQSVPILTDAEINSGMVFPVVAETFLGTFGIILMMVLMLFAVMSTGAGQVISIASLVIYDIYMPYLRPFHEDHKVRLEKAKKAFHVYQSE